MLTNGEFQLNQRIIEFLLTFPVPFGDVLREQVTSAVAHTKIYPDCYIIEFSNTKAKKKMPEWLPLVPQCGRIYTERDLYMCQIYVEAGYIVQFEIVNMTTSAIDWDQFWDAKVIFDVLYDDDSISKCLTETGIVVDSVQSGKNYVLMSVHGEIHKHTICFYGCEDIHIDFLALPLTCCASVRATPNQHEKIFATEDGRIFLKYRLVCRQDTLTLA